MSNAFDNQMEQFQVRQRVGALADKVEMALAEGGSESKLRELRDAFRDQGFQDTMSENLRSRAIRDAVSARLKETPTLDFSPQLAGQIYEDVLATAQKTTREIG